MKYNVIKYIQAGFGNKLFCSLLVLLFGLITSCNSQKETDSDQIGSTNYPYQKAELVKVDSIMIDVVGNIRIYDYNPTADLFLAGDVPNAQEASFSQGLGLDNLGILVVNTAGEIIHQFKRTDDGPSGHGNSAADIFFVGDTAIGVWSQKGLYTYSLDGELLFNRAELHSRQLLNDVSYSVATLGEKDNLSLANPKRTDRILANRDSTFLLTRALTIYNFNKLLQGVRVDESQEFVLNYPDHSIYQPGSKQLLKHLPPRISVNREESKLNVLFHEYAMLYTVALDESHSIDSVALQPYYFGDYVQMPVSEDDGQKYYDWLNFGGYMANSYYHDLVQIGPYTLLRYNPALSPGLVEDLVSTGGPYSSDRWPTIRRNDYQMLYQLFQGPNKLVQDFQLPALEPTSGQVAFQREREIRGQLIGGKTLDQIYLFVPNEGENEREYELIEVYQFILTPAESK